MVSLLLSGQQEFEQLTAHFLQLAKQKLGFPTSFLGSDPNFVDNEVLGIKNDSLASILINEVGDPFTKSDTWQLEVKDHEVKVIQTLSKYFRLGEEGGYGYITTGGTEANEACIRWLKQHLEQQVREKKKYISYYRDVPKPISNHSSLISSSNFGLWL